MVFGDKILQYPQKMIDPVELGMYRRSMPHIMKYAYENKDYELIKKMEACGVRVQYRRLAKMYKKDGNKELMEECYKKSVDAHEDYARYVYALRMEEEGNKDEAVRYLLDVARDSKGHPRERESAYTRLRENYGINEEIPDELLQNKAIKRRMNSIFDISAYHPYSEYPVRHIMYLLAAAILALAGLFVNRWFFALFAVFALYTYCAWGYSPNEDYVSPDIANDDEPWLAQFEGDQDLGWVVIADIYEKPSVFLDGDDSIIGTDNFKVKEYQYYKNLVENSRKIYLARKKDLIARFFAGEKEVLPFLENFYYVHYDGEKFINTVDKIPKSETWDDRFKNWAEILVPPVDDIWTMEMEHKEVTYYPDGIHKA